MDRSALHKYDKNNKICYIFNHMDMCADKKRSRKILLIEGKREKKGYIKCQFQ